MLLGLGWLSNNRISESGEWSVWRMAVTGGKTARAVEITYVDGFGTIKDSVSFLSTCGVSIDDVIGMNFSLS